MHIYDGMAHPTEGVRRLSEVGEMVQDAGIAVDTYFTSHALGENSPDSLACKIDAAKALGARALCLNTTSDDEIENSNRNGGTISAERRSLEAFMLADWERARRELRAAGLAIRLHWFTGIHRRRSLIGARGSGTGRAKGETGDEGDRRERVECPRQDS